MPLHTRFVLGIGKRISVLSHLAKNLWVPNEIVVIENTDGSRTLVELRTEGLGGYQHVGSSERLCQLTDRVLALCSAAQMMPR